MTQSELSLHVPYQWDSMYREWTHCSGVVFAVEEAIARYGCPTIVNADQGIAIHERGVHWSA